MALTKLTSVDKSVAKKLLVPVDAALAVHTADIETNTNSITDNTTAIAVNAAAIVTVAEGQTAGVIVFATYALLDAYTPATAQEKASFKVTNDSNTSLNGYYSWVSGTTYTKDAGLVENVVDPNNTSDAVSGFGINETTRKKADIVVGKNKSNKNTYTDGYIQLNNGNLSAGASFSYSDFIDVVVGEAYISNRTMRTTCYFDEQKNVVAGGSIVNSTQFTVPVGVTYVTISYTSFSARNSAQLETGLVETPFENYINAVPEDQLHIDNLVPPLVVDKADLEVGKNKLDKDAFTDGGYFTANGNFTANASYTYSDFIELIQGQDYINSEEMRFLTYYDASFSVVSGGSNIALSSFTVPTGTGIKYCVLSFNGVNKKNTAQLEVGSTVTLFEDYRVSVKEEQLFLNNLIPSLITNKADLEVGKNKSNTSTYNLGALQLKNGNLSTSANFSYSDFIKVEVGQNYICNNDIRSSCFFDVNKRVVTGGQDVNHTVFTIPLGTAFITISFANATNRNTAQLEIGTTTTAFEPFKITVPASQLPPSAAANEVYYGHLDGEKWCAYGDSITQNYTWKDIVMSHLSGVTLYNRGISGTKVEEHGSEAYVYADGSYSGVNPPTAQPVGTSLILSSLSNQARVNTIPLDTTLITVWGGINDVFQSPFSTLGGLTDTTVATFYGAYQLMIERIYARIPNAKIIIVNLTSVNTDFTLLNSNGNTVENYRVAVLAVANKYKYRVNS